MALREGRFRSLRLSTRSSGNLNRLSSVSSWWSRVSVRKVRVQGPWSRPTMKEASSAMLLNVTGCILGFIRFAYFIAAFAVLSIHLIFPPVALRGVGGYSWEDYVAGVMEYIRFAFEVIASLVVAGDAVVTWSSLNGALESSSTFMAQIDLHPLLARTVLILIVCSSYSTPAETFIADTWSNTWAIAYLYLFAVTLASGVIMLIIFKIPGFADHAWLNYDRNPHKDCDETWTPVINLEAAPISQQKQNTSTRTVKLLCLVPPISALCLNVAALIFLSPEAIHRNPNSLGVWRAVVERILQLILCLILMGFIIYQIKKVKKKKIPSPIKACLMYVIINALTLVHLLTDVVWVEVPLYTLGLFAMVIPIFGFSLSTSVTEKKKRASYKVAWLAGFMKNFTQIGKWLRLSEVIAVILSLCGLVLAASALPLPWFRIHFENDPQLDTLMETIRKFNQSITDVTSELTRCIEMAEKEFKDITCEQMAGAAAGAAVAVIIPGVGQATKQILRIARYMRNFARKALSYKSQFYRLGSTLRKVKGVVNDVKKPLMVGITLENMGMIMFLMPVIITGIIVIFFAFWPRKLRSGNVLMGIKKSCLVLGTATLHLVVNSFGLVLFEVWGPMLAVIADGLPLTTAELVKERGWPLVEGGYACAVVASVIFFLQAVFSILRPGEEEPIVLSTGVSDKRKLIKRVGSDENIRRKLHIPDQKDLRRRSARTRTKIKKVTETLDESLKRMKMFRASMMDTAPPRAWILCLMITIIAVVLSIMAFTYEWMTFDPIMKPKWARLIAILHSESNSTMVLQDEIEKDSKDCIFDIDLNLKELLPTIISPEFIKLWRDLIKMLKSSVFNLFDFDFIDFNFRIWCPFLMKVIFSAPNLICCGLVVIGFITSFSVRASYYFPTHEVMSWISKISVFVLVGVMNTIIFITKIFAGTEVPFYTLNIKIHPGFYLSSAAAVLILLVWILLVVETLAPPMFVKRSKHESENDFEHSDDDAFESSERIDLGPKRIDLSPKVEGRRVVKSSSEVRIKLESVIEDNQNEASDPPVT
ncbi:uncharacterized protein LOC135489153 [Lineus longissimus]|uniref:uncharacterized protein LOC135489153 n=1 Tax=Lineus longissimus TaxID=88925 RepID=UPI002B4C35D8